jgi:hypothetical protein
MKPNTTVRHGDDALVEALNNRYECLADNAHLQPFEQFLLIVVYARWAKKYTPLLNLGVPLPESCIID